MQRRSRASTTPHTQECVPDVQRRSRGSATLPRHMLKNAFQTCNAGGAGAQPYRPNTRERVSRRTMCNAGRYRTLPTEGIEPTHCCQYWILSPARLPIPPRRPFARRQLLIRLQRNASVNETGVRIQETGVKNCGSYRIRGRLFGPVTVIHELPRDEFDSTTSRFDQAFVSVFLLISRNS